MTRKSVLAAVLISVLLGPSALEAGAGGKPLRFVLKDDLTVGGRTAVKLRNNGDVAYNYNPYYEACYMVFRVESGRKFIVPEGTHCDIVAKEQVEPGETVTLFKWDLDECTKDNWGCEEAKNLPAGKYVMKGSFKPKGGGDSVRVKKHFRIGDP
jgi:hypothetical protein